MNTFKKPASIEVSNSRLLYLFFLPVLFGVVAGGWSGLAVSAVVIGVSALLDVALGGGWGVFKALMVIFGALALIAASIVLHFALLITILLVAAYLFFSATKA